MSALRKCDLCGLLVVLATTAYAGDQKPPCYNTAQTQYELNTCAGSEFAAADQTLNEVYEQVLRQYRTDRPFIEKFKVAQRAWLRFRDAEMEALFPKADEQGEYGSVFPMCFAQWKSQLTHERTDQLRRWLKGGEEGDACRGSIRRRPESNPPSQPTPKKRRG
jgi:uncharacterized protein YecT (DUF1311 family)